MHLREKVKAFQIYPNHHHSMLFLLGCDNKNEEKEVEINILETQINALVKVNNVENLILKTHKKDVETIEPME